MRHSQGPRAAQCLPTLACPGDFSVLSFWWISKWCSLGVSLIAGKRFNFKGPLREKCIKMQSSSLLLQSILFMFNCSYRASWLVRGKVQNEITLLEMRNRQEVWFIFESSFGRLLPPKSQHIYSMCGNQISEKSCWIFNLMPPTESIQSRIQGTTRSINSKWKQWCWHPLTTLSFCQHEGNNAKVSQNRNDWRSRETPLACNLMAIPPVDFQVKLISLTLQPFPKLFSFLSEGFYS